MTCLDLFLPYPTFLSVGTRRKINLCKKIAHCEKKTYFKFLCESCSIFVTEKIRLQFNVAIISNLQGRRILSFSGSGLKIQIRQKRSGSIQKGPDPTGPQQSGRHCLKDKSRYLYLFFYFPIFVRVPSPA